MMVAPGEERVAGLLGIYVYADDVVAAVERLRERKWTIEAIFSPIRLREVQTALGRDRSIVAFLTLLGGVTGGLALIALAVWAHLSFHLVTWGKPVLPWVPWVIVCFEGMVLFAVLFSFVGWIFAGRLPVTRLPLSYDPVFSGDRFGVLVPCTGDGREEVYHLLRETGAEEIREVKGQEEEGEPVLRARGKHA